MLKFEFEESREILIELLRQNGYFEDWYENDGLNNYPILHSLSIFSMKSRQYRLKKIVEDVIINNRFEVSNYIYLKCQTLGQLYDLDFLLEKKLEEFYFCDTDSIYAYIIDVEETIKYNFERNKLEDQEIIKMRFDGNTLESVGQKVNLTRERVRQIVAKYIRSLDNLFKDLFSCFFSDFAILPADLEIFDLSEETKNHLLNYMKNSQIFYHVKMFDIYVFKNLEEYNRILKLTKDFLDSTSINDQDIDEYLSELNVNISRDTVISYLVLSKYYYFNGKYIKYSRYADYLVEIIYAKFPEGIELKQLTRTKDFDKLISYSNKYFPNVKFVSEPRSVHSRLAEHLVSIDRSVYILKNMIEEKHFDISFVLDYLESSDLRVYYFSELYSRFSKLLLLEGIGNWYFLRELIKLSYYGDATFSRDFIEINKRTGSGFLNERVAEFVAESSTTVTTKQISAEFSNFSTIMLYSATNNNIRIKKWGRDSWLSIEKYNNLPKGNNFLTVTKKMIGESRYVSFEKLFFQLSKHYNLGDFYILSPDNLSAYYINVFPSDFRYFDEGFSALDFDISNKVEERYVFLLGTYPKWNYSEMKHFMSSQKLKQTTINYINRELSRSSIRIDRENNILLSHFFIGEGIVRQLDEDIGYIMKNSEAHLTPHYLIENGYLPHDSGVSWNWFILTSVINSFSTKYKVILPVPADRRFQEGLIIEKNSEMLISDRIIHYFTKLGLGRISEAELKKYLSEKRITENIPYEFYHNEIINIEQGYFSLKEIME